MPTPARSVPTVSASDADLARAAAQKVVTTHQRLAEWLRAGQTLAQIDAFVAKTLDDLQCRSCFLGYKSPHCPPFPSHACLSVNDCVVHGTAGYFTQPMRPGDLLKIDIGVTHKGFIGDAAWTYSFGTPEPKVRRLMDCGKESLARGVKTLRPENTYLAWARCVQEFVEHECKFHLVRGLGGHGIGRKLHAAPYVANTVPTFPGEWPDAFTKCAPGTLLAVEPMIAMGTGDTNQKRREWPIFTKDHSLAVHYEHDVLVTEGEPEILTDGLQHVPDVIER